MPCRKAPAPVREWLKPGTLCPASPVSVGEKSLLVSMRTSISLRPIINVVRLLWSSYLVKTNPPWEAAAGTGAAIEAATGAVGVVGAAADVVAQPVP